MPDSAFRPGSDEEWDELVRQLRLRPKPTPQPFFYARVQARLLANADKANRWRAGWLRWPAYAAVLGALVLAVRSDGSAGATAYHSPRAPYPAQQLAH